MWMDMNHWSMSQRSFTQRDFSSELHDIKTDGAFRTKKWHISKAGTFEYHLLNEKWTEEPLETQQQPIL